MTTARIVMALTVLAAVGLAYMRLNGHHEQWFQATAHLLVGGWIVASVLKFIARDRVGGWFYAAVAVALSAVEVFAFVRDWL